jgi:hypothetical protein
MMAQQDNPWIPVDDNTVVFPQIQYEVTWRNKAVAVLPGSRIDLDLALAVREYKPCPYVPPKPKPREWWIIEKRKDVNDDAYRVEQRDADLQIINQVHVREVLPGDPSPEAIEEVVARLRELVDQRTGATPYLMEKLADRLEGKP